MQISVRAIRCTGIVVFAIVAYCIPIPTLNVLDLTQQADLIVVGRIISITPQDSHTTEVAGQTTRVQTMHGEMRVDQILKGSISSPSVAFTFDLPDAPIGYKSMTPSSYRIVFFSKKQGEYSFTSPYYPSLSAVPGLPVSGTDTLDNLTSQLRWVIESARTGFQQKQDALGALKTLDSSAATAALRRALDDRSIELQLVASAALLQRDDISGLAIAEAALTKRPPAIPDYILHNVAYAISQGVQDARAVPTLARLLRLPEIETRRAAASALWHTHSALAEPGLATALNDQDFEVRFYGVAGLAEITGQSGWHPNMEVFHEDEIKYLQHWRDWVRANYPVQQER